MTQEEIAAKEAADIAKAQEMITKTVKEQTDLAVKAANEAHALELKTAKDANDLIVKGLKEDVEKISAEVKKQGQFSKKDEPVLGFQEVVKKSIGDNLEQITNLSPSDGQVKITLKEITSANFANGSFAASTTETRNGVYDSPFAPVWLRNIFPNTSTSKANVEYLQLDGSNGAAAIWARGTGDAGADVDKPSSEPKFTLKSVALAWIAGIARVGRELLDDIDYLGQTIGNHLLYSRWGIFVAENKMITDYIASVAVPYAGTKTIGVEKIVDAAFGYMLSDYIQPTHVLMNNKDYVTYVELNKASGSGEYDLPNSQLAIIDGRLVIGGSLIAVPVPTLAVGTAYVVGANESEFVSRMSPELKMYEEDRDNIPKNLITFRAEERAAFFTKDVNSLIKITLPSAST